MTLTRNLMIACLMLLPFSSAARADVVLLSNLTMPVGAGVSPTLFTGQSFQQGTADSAIPDVTIQVAEAYGLTSTTMLELETRNGDGSVGSSLYSNFSDSVVPPDGTLPVGSERIIFKANTNFTLTAGTSYWLVVSDTATNGVPWQFTPSGAYQSVQAYGIPAFRSSWSSNADNGNGSMSTYFDPSSGNQLFQLSVAIIPEPSSLLLAGLSSAFGVSFVVMRRRANHAPQAT